MIIKEVIKKSFFDILSPPLARKEASPNLLNVPKSLYHLSMSKTSEHTKNL